MNKLFALTLSLSLTVLAPAAHAGIFKKMIVVGAVVMAGKAIARKHQETKNQREQQAQAQPQNQNAPAPAVTYPTPSQSNSGGTWSNRTPYEQR